MKNFPLFLYTTIIILCVSCSKDKDPTNPAPTKPAISSFTPTSGGTGISVTISGSNFTGTTAVSFGGVAATSFTVVNATTITAVVANGNTGEVKVTTPGGTATKTGFTFTLGPPTLATISQTRGSIGSTITLTGTNFNDATSVTFGGTAASFVIVDNTSIKASLAEGASGEVKVVTP